MSPDGLEKLTEAQRDCLRRVLQHMTSKDIARELGISPHTVDQRLRVAVKTLGVSSRVEAARLLAEHEGLGASAYQPTVYQSPLVVPPDVFASFDLASAGVHRTPGQEFGEQVRERQLSYQAFVPESAPPIPLPFPVKAGEANTLSGVQRVGWIIAIAFLSAIAFGAVLAGLEALGSILRG